MKITKRMRKKLNGMNSATKMHFKVGFRPPVFSGENGSVNERGALIPPYTKMLGGTPYVNPNNF